jgi:hypothetical protein
MQDENEIEEYEDWRLEGKEKEFINMKNSPGSEVLIFEGEPECHKSKYGNKSQWWFPVKKMTGPPDNCVFEDAWLSTASKQLRKKLTAMEQKYPERLFNGKMVVGISWEGDGMSRHYSVVPLADDQQEIFLKSVGRSMF